jgi:hypothetical protein
VNRVFIKSFRVNNHWILPLISGGASCYWFLFFLFYYYYYFGGTITAIPTILYWIWSQLVTGKQSTWQESALAVAWSSTYGQTIIFNQERPLQFFLVLLLINSWLKWSFYQPCFVPWNVLSPSQAIHPLSNSSVNLLYIYIFFGSMWIHLLRIYRVWLNVFFF